MYNPRQAPQASFLDDMSHYFANLVTRISDMVIQANEFMKETHRRVRDDPANFIEMAGTIDTSKIPSQPLIQLSTIAETLVFFEGKNKKFAPLLITYRSNVNVLFIKYYRTILEGVLATFLGDTKAKEYAKKADKRRFNKELTE